MNALQDLKNRRDNVAEEIEDNNQLITKLVNRRSFESVKRIIDDNLKLEGELDGLNSAIDVVEHTNESALKEIMELVTCRGDARNKVGSIGNVARRWLEVTNETA